MLLNHDLRGPPRSPQALSQTDGVDEQAWLDLLAGGLLDDAVVRSLQRPPDGAALSFGSLPREAMADPSLARDLAATVPALAGGSPFRSFEDLGIGIGHTAPPFSSEAPSGPTVVLAQANGGPRRGAGGPAGGRGTDVSRVDQKPLEIMHGPRVVTVDPSGNVTSSQRFAGGAGRGPGRGHARRSAAGGATPKVQEADGAKGNAGRAEKDEDKPRTYDDLKWKPIEDVKKKLEGEITTVSPTAAQIGDVMREFREKARNGDFTFRNVVKSVVPARASQQRSFVFRDKLEARGVPVPDGVRGLRAEDTGSQIMRTPAGQVILNATVKDKPFDPVAREAVRNMFWPHGRSERFVIDFEQLAKTADREQLTRDMRALVADGSKGVAKDWLDVASRLHGIGAGKAGYQGTWAGYGHLPVGDVNLLRLHIQQPPELSRRVLATDGWRVLEEIRRRNAELVPKLPPEFETFGAAIRHHLILEKIKNKPISHDPIIRMLRGAEVAPMPGSFPTQGAVGSA